MSHTIPEPEPEPEAALAPARTPVSDAVNGANGADQSSLDSTGRDLGLSGFRMGVPRAQGPDPYARFDNAAAPPSNVRHLPTPDRELGDNLKLSGLLGPSEPGPESKKEKGEGSRRAEKKESPSKKPKKRSKKAQKKATDEGK